MFKISVGNLALTAAPAGEHLSEEEYNNKNADAVGPARPVLTTSASTSSAPASAVSDPACNGGNLGAAPVAPPATAGGQHTAVSVRPQLELLGDLCRAVGHGEAALVCASLLRDEAGTVATLRCVVRGWGGCGQRCSTLLVSFK